MSKRTMIKGVYTDLDSLFDTRAIVLSTLTNNGKYDINLTIDKYQNRIRDNFGTLSSKIFHYFYSKRKKTVLNVAPVTSVHKVILDYFMDIVAKAKSDITFNLYVNVYPYDLRQEELEVIILGINKLLPNVNIITINQPISDLSKDWMSEKVGMLIAYNGMEWLRVVLENANQYEGELLNLKVLVPCLYHGSMDSSLLTPEGIRTTVLFYRTICDFDFLDSKVFSLA